MGTDQKSSTWMDPSTWTLTSVIDGKYGYTISNFRKVETENTVLVEEQESLIAALKKVKFHYSCLVKKATIITLVEEDCKQGSQTLEEIYKRYYDAQDMNQCTTEGGVVYTDVSVIKTSLEELYKDTAYSTTCKLNDDDLRQTACVEYKCDEYEASEVAVDNDITVDQLNKLCTNYNCLLSRRER